MNPTTRYKNAACPAISSVTGQNNNRNEIHDAIEHRITGLNPCQLSCAGTQLKEEGQFHFCGLTLSFRFFLLTMLPPAVLGGVGFSPKGLESRSLCAVVAEERKRTDGVACGGDTAVVEDLEVDMITPKDGGYSSFV